MSAPPGLPYSGVTAESLLQHWCDEQHRQESKHGKCRVLTFHKEEKQHGHFSNWFVHPPFDFEVPVWCQLDGLPQVVPVSFTEKALMICKAGLFGDREAYESLLDIQYPKDAKDIGQGVQDFDRETWGRTAASVAFEIAVQKYGKLPELGSLLQNTGDMILAEAAPGDNLWGIGLKGSDPHSRSPATWCGTNILGWSLMEVRSVLGTGVGQGDLSQVAGIGAAEAAGEDDPADVLLALSIEEALERYPRFIKLFSRGTEDQQKAWRQQWADPGQEIRDKLRKAHTAGIFTLGDRR